MEFDLEKRTIVFSSSVIKFLSSLKIGIFNRNIVEQLLRSATSVGANYREANGAISNNDFKNKIYICRKEIQETKYWIELLASLSPEYKINLRELWKEAQEISLIFCKITHTLRKNNKNYEI